MSKTRHRSARAAGLFAEALREAEVRHSVLMIPEADHAFMRFAWEREVIARTLAWLRAER